MRLQAVRCFLSNSRHWPFGNLLRPCSGSACRVCRAGRSSRGISAARHWRWSRRRCPRWPRRGRSSRATSTSACCWPEAREAVPDGWSPSHSFGFVPKTRFWCLKEAKVCSPPGASERLQCDQPAAGASAEGALFSSCSMCHERLGRGQASSGTLGRCQPQALRAERYSGTI